MSRRSRIHYNPALSVTENAARNGVTEAAIRYYIRTNSIDRQFDRKQQIIADCRKYLQHHPKATWQDVQQNTGHGLATIRKYREFITTEQELTDFDSIKAKKRQLRQVNNYYVAHPSATQDILNVEMFATDILEPFCGEGIMAEVLKKNGHNVEAYDIINRGYGKVGDFFKVDYPEGKYDIVSNPPYDASLNDIIKRCYRLCKKKVAMLLPVNYLSGLQRLKEIYKTIPPKTVYVYANNIVIGRNGDYSKAVGYKINYAWYLWEKGYEGETVVRWITNEE